MKNDEKIYREWVILAWVLYIAIAISMILFLAANRVDAFDWRVFNFKWDKIEYVDDYFISIHVEKATGGTDDYTRTIRGETEFKDDLKIGDRYTIKVVPILPGGTHGEVMVEYIITPGKEPNRTIRF